MHSDPSAVVSPSLERAMFQAAAERLAARWRTLAERIDPYSQSAARAYKQAAEDIEDELRRHGERIDALQAQKAEFIAAVKSVVWNDRQGGGQGGRLAG
jgi:hypothetical protein